MNKYYLMYGDYENATSSYYIISHAKDNNLNIIGTIIKIKSLVGGHTNLKTGLKSTFNKYYATLVKDPLIINELDKLVTFQ